MAGRVLVRTSRNDATARVEICDALHLVPSSAGKRVTRAANRFHRAVESLEKIRTLRRVTGIRKRPRMLAEHSSLSSFFGDGFIGKREMAEELVIAR